MRWEGAVSLTDIPGTARLDKGERRDRNTRGFTNNMFYKDFYLISCPMQNPVNHSVLTGLGFAKCKECDPKCKAGASGSF